MQRLFVAAYPSAAIADELAALPRPVESGVRWTTRAQWHVTLRFLGSVEGDLAVRRLAALDAAPATARLGPRVSPLGRHVVVAPVLGLDELAVAVTAVTGDIGQPLDPRPFTGHITLARLKHRSACGLAGRPLSGSWPVTAVELVASDRHADGARYTTVTRLPLGG